MKLSWRDGRLMFMNLLAGMVAVGGWPQPGEVSEGTGRARLCAYVKHSTLNSVIEQELRDRREEDRVNATLLSGGSVLVNPSIKKVRTKFKKSHPSPREITFAKPI